MARDISSRPFSLPALSASPQRIGIVGGGMAGLSCAYHLLRKTSQEGNPVRVTILDEDEVGRKGASSVAGGYVRLLTCFAMEHYAYQ